MKLFENDRNIADQMVLAVKLDEIAALAKQVTRSPDLERLCALAETTQQSGQTADAPRKRETHTGSMDDPRF